MSKPIRVRFAPSPTGRLHIGGARTALFNWAWARRNGGAFILRIEDTDMERSAPEHEAAILEGLRWLGLEWDEGPDVGGEFGPYRQSERNDSYAAASATLLEAGWSYRCFCPAERLKALREERMQAGQKPGYDGCCRELTSEETDRRAEAGEPCVLRFKVPEGKTAFVDRVRGRVEFDNAEVDDWIMQRSDGSPTYNFVVVCDDSAMGITLVMRGEEHLTNTPKQVLLYGALGFDPPEFAHLPLMLGKDGKKLSKRTGDTALQDYSEAGFPPEAVVNFLCLQGWALDDKTEVFSAEELLARFDPSDVKKGGAVFDPEKFQWMSGEYIRSDDAERVMGFCAPYVVAAGQIAAEDLESRRAFLLAVVRTEQERIRTYAELPGRIAYLFASDENLEYHPKAVKGAQKHGDAPEFLGAYRAWLAPQLEAGEIDAEALRTASRGWIEEQGRKIPALFQPLRCVLTGEPGGPDLFDVMALLGPERTLGRIERGIERLAAPAGGDASGG